MSRDSGQLNLARSEFAKISGLVYQVAGINLQPGKEELVKSRLAKRVQSLSLESFDQYVRHVEADRSGKELAIMVEELTTNKTFFFREIQHFDYMRERILPGLAAAKGRIRIWSAGCSSGEEPYSIAILLRERLPNIDRRDVRVLATDLSTAVLRKAAEGVYHQDQLNDVPAALLKKHFSLAALEGDGGPRHYKVNDNLKAMVKIAKLNLMGNWPMGGPFDLIFCRNVMIYFDKPTQQTLATRFAQLLSPGGHLFIGHAESLAASTPGLHYIKPAVYVRADD